jgi:hypothetical protein
MKKLLALFMVASAPLAFAQGITVNYGVGFADATVTTSPITSLPSTLGADRVACYEAAVLVWEAVLDISVEIEVDAAFSSQGGTTGAGTPLGFAGPETAHRDFAGAPIADTYYVQAQANQIAGVDLDALTSDLAADFNADVDDPVLVPSFSWYYGIDGAPPGGTRDFFSTILHELGHGLGFLSLVDETTGAKFNGRDDIYSEQLRWGGSGGNTAFNALTNGGRVSAVTSVNELEWIGAIAIGDATFNPSGDPVLMYAPASINSGSTLSHWDTSNTPNLLMEPFATDAFIDVTLETAAFLDMAWPISNAPTVDSQSGGGVTLAGNNETLSVTLSGLSGGETYSWEKGGVPVSDGATGSGATISGATTTSITITNAQSADTGTYTFVSTDGGDSFTLASYLVIVINAVPNATWIGLAIAGVLLILGGTMTLRRQRS